MRETCSDRTGHIARGAWAWVLNYAGPFVAKRPPVAWALTEAGVRRPLYRPNVPPAARTNNLE